MQQLNITQHLRKDIYNDIVNYKNINFEITNDEIDNGKYINLIQIQNKIYKSIISNSQLEYNKIIIEN